jgi:hypothetical protein
MGNNAEIPDVFHCEFRSAKVLKSRGIIIGNENNPLFACFIENNDFLDSVSVSFGLVSSRLRGKISK